jgi:AhpD family alkylhydroperoxidase
MYQYPVHTLESAPEASRKALTGLKQAVGLIPNLAATMAESPVLLDGFVGVFGRFHGSGFSGAQRQALLLANAVTNACAWAVAFHSTMALEAGATPDDVRAIRERRHPGDPGLAALVGVTQALIEKRGHLGEEDVHLRAFEQAGFSRGQLLEVIAGIAVSTMANYTGNVARPPLEEPFRGQSWSDR